MRIGLDGISQGDAVEDGRGALGSLLPALYERMATLAPEHEFLLFAARHANAYRDLGAENLTVVPCAVPRPRALRVAYEQAWLPRLARQARVDVYYASTNVLPLSLSCRSVLVMNALQCFAFPEMFTPVRRRYLQAFIPQSLRRATRVIAVSRFLGDEAVRLCGADPERVDVVLHGSWDNVREFARMRHSADVDAVAARYDRGGPFILAVSRLYAFKNLPRLIAAFAALKRSHDIPHRLVIVGADADVTRRDLQAIADREGVGQDVALPGTVPNRHIGALYMKAAVFVHPSLYETFGVTPLEAMVCGCPVVASNVTSIPEIVGDAALLVEPGDVGALAAAMYRALTDQALRKDLIARGYRRAAAFSTEREASETLGVIERAALGATSRRPRSLEERQAAGYAPPTGGM